MRIAYVNADSGVPAFGRKGCSIHVQEVIRGFRAHGSAVDLFTMRAGGDPPPGLAAVRVHQLPKLHKVDDPAEREQAALRVNTEVRAALEREGPFDLIYERYALWSFAGMEYAKQHCIPGILEVNAPLIEEQAASRTLVDRKGAEEATARAFGAAPALVGVSAEVVAYLERQPEARGRVRVIPNGVDASRFHPGVTPSLPAPRGTFTVGFVGTLKPWHGLPALMDAFAALRESVPAARLLIVGDGPERAQLEKQMEARGLRAATHLTGAVDPADIPGLLASMDAAVAPYPAASSFYFSPLKVYEYMAASLPVVASRIGQLDGLLVDGVNGLLCPPGDGGALTGALARLSRDPDYGMRLGQAARETVCRDHTWNAVVAKLLAIVKKSGVAVGGGAS
jgi:glycosyltransferase involved in cell wall biosynthesis